MLHEEARSLKDRWRRSGGRWSKLKKMLIAHRGSRCEKCGAEPERLDAHEVWDYVDAADAGLDPGRIRKMMDEHRAALRRLGYPKPVVRRSKPMARALTDIKLLCEPCHRREPSLPGVGPFDLVLIAHYSGFHELPNYKTFDEWQQAMRDEADAFNAEDWVYAEAEIDDSGFSRCGWINK